MELAAKVRDTIRRFDLLAEGERILVACSGGADSTCLLWILKDLQAEGSWDLTVGHFNHRLRRDAAADERFVRELAAAAGCPFYAASRDVAAYARDRGMNLEEAGRELRYDFLEKTAAAAGAHKIATAHTQDDQAETFLMRLLRGSGRSGLGGIPVRRGPIIRPLLQVSRAEVEDYLRIHSRTWRRDPSNRDRRYLRNRIRLELVPYLRDRFDPDIIGRLGRLTDVLREEEEWMKSLTQTAADAATFSAGGSWGLDMKALSRFPLALRRRVVRSFLSRLRGHLRHISFHDITAILNLAEGRRFTLERGLVLQRRRDRVQPAPPPARHIGYRHRWDGKGPLEIPELGLKFSGRTVPRARLRRLKRDNRREAVLDAELLTFPLTVRCRREGDRYRPLGSPGRARLKEIFRAHGIPSEERDRHPVFVSGRAVVWVLGLPVAEEARITPATSRVFIIRKESPAVVL